MNFAERRRALLDGGGFPAEPTSYSTLLTSLTAHGSTWAAPEDGWFEIRLLGRSGAGGKADVNLSSGYIKCASGGGGGGGAVVISRVKMQKGDTISMTNLIDCSVTITSSLESYSTMSATTAADGFAGSYREPAGGEGGNGGKASGGNYVNANGNYGGKGEGAHRPKTDYIYGGSGGTPGYTGGNNGGNGGGVSITNGDADRTSPAYSRPGTVKIYRGDTN